MSSFHHQVAMFANLRKICGFWWKLWGWIWQISCHDNMVTWLSIDNSLGIQVLRKGSEKVFNHGTSSWNSWQMSGHLDRSRWFAEQVTALSGCWHRIWCQSRLHCLVWFYQMFHGHSKAWFVGQLSPLLVLDPLGSPIWIQILLFLPFKLSDH